MQRANSHGSDIEGQGNEIHANENLNSISTTTALDALVEDVFVTKDMIKDYHVN